MSFADPKLLLIAAVGLLTVLFAIAGWLIGRQRRRRFGYALVALRLGVLLLLLAMLWQALFPGTVEAPPPPDPVLEPARLVVLQDDSLSMDFAVDADTTRRQLANRLATDLRRAADTATEPPEITWLYVGADVVAAEDRDRLHRHATHLNGALDQALARFRCDRLLVLSDGASTDGPPPAYLRDWMANRGVQAFAIGTDLPGEQSFDAQLTKAGSAPVNPRFIEGELRTYGTALQPLTVSLRIDDTAPLTQALGTANREFRFPVPTTLGEGWHSYRLEIAPVAGEVTALNNVGLGVFRVSPPNRILYLYGQPRRENLPLVNLLRQEYPDRLQVVSVFTPELWQLNLRNYQLVVLSEVAPTALPAALARAIDSGDLPCLVLGGAMVAQWTTAQLPHSPVQNVVGTMDLTERFRGEARVNVAAENRLPAFRGLTLGELDLNLVQVVRASERSGPLLAAHLGQQQLPVVLTNSYQTPTCLVALTETTWKWAMHPDAARRYAYRQFWSTLFTWILGEENVRHPLLVTHAELPGRPGFFQLTVTPRNPAMLPQLDAVRLAIDDPAGERVVEMERTATAYTYIYEQPRELPAIAWFQAGAELPNQRAVSERLPLLMANEASELLDTRPRPDHLRSLTGNLADRFAFAGEAADLLTALVAPTVEARSEPPARQRQPWRELPLAALAVLLVGSEWLLERRLKERRMT